MNAGPADVPLRKADCDHPPRRGSARAPRCDGTGGAGRAGWGPVESRERLDLQLDAGVALHLLDAIPQPAGARQECHAEARPPEHLPARRQPHAVLPGGVARRLDVIERQLDAAAHKSASDVNEPSRRDPVSRIWQGHAPRCRRCPGSRATGSTQACGRCRARPPRTS